jgi:hypothetical protein
MDSAAAAFSSGARSHELDFASALQAAEAIRKKQVSSVELTRHVFERIERYNPAINAFAYQLKEEALAQAKKADEALARHESLGVFHGVPVNGSSVYLGNSAFQGLECAALLRSGGPTAGGRSRLDRRHQRSGQSCRLAVLQSDVWNHQ